MKASIKYVGSKMEEGKEFSDIPFVELSINGSNKKVFLVGMVGEDIVKRTVSLVDGLLKELSDESSD